MKHPAMAAAVVCILWSAAFAIAQEKQDADTTRPAERRGFAVATEGRPQRFPHRIWAACDYEAQTLHFGWFGIHERKDLVTYAGNTGARKAEPFGKYPMKYVGCNPVPGPRMGKINKMYCRYKLWGTDQAQFQHYSLSSSDNCNIRVSGLTQDKWSEVTLNFTRDSRRNNNSPGAFKNGERMDDLKVFIREAKSGADYGMILDDVIFFAEDPALPPEPEPFPNRVIYATGFDTGTYNEKSAARYHPGEFEIVKEPPAGAYWVAVKSVPKADSDDAHILLKLQPVRDTTFHLGERPKLRIRFRLEGSPGLLAVLRNKTAGVGHVVPVEDVTQKQWITRYLDIAKAEAGREPEERGPKAGDVVESIEFIVPGSATLYLDEIVLYDAGKPAEPAKKGE